MPNDNDRIGAVGTGAATDDPRASRDPEFMDRVRRLLDSRARRMAPGASMNRVGVPQRFATLDRLGDEFARLDVDERFDRALGEGRR